MGSDPPDSIKVEPEPEPEQVEQRTYTFKKDTAFFIVMDSTQAKLDSLLIKIRKK